MSFKWTEAHLKDGNILDSGEFDTGYNSLKGAINSGLDRENLPNASIKDHHLAPDAFLSYAVKEGIRAQQPLERADVSGGVNHILCKTYNVYGGGWVTNSAQTLTKRFIEGMLHLEFNAWYYLNNASQDSNATAPSKFLAGRWCRFALSIDNVIVCESHELWQNMGTVHLVADIPITTGTHEVSVSWSVPGYDERYGSSYPQMKDEPLFYYDGGTILAINRYR